MVPITVIKQDTRGRETWRYQGHLLDQEPDRYVLEAFFDREDMNLHGLLLKKGDRFLETYYTNRWYNIFEIYTQGENRFRGWYCNIAQPALLVGHTLTYVDLALDLLVFPDGRQIVLDEDEFNQLDITPDMRRQGLEALQELKLKFATMLNQS